MSCTTRRIPYGQSLRSAWMTQIGRNVRALFDSSILSLIYVLLEMLSEMHDKLSQAVKLYDKLLTDQVSHPTWRMPQQKQQPFMPGFERRDSQYISGQQMVASPQHQFSPHQGPMSPRLAHPQNYPPNATVAPVSATIPPSSQFSSTPGQQAVSAPVLPTTSQFVSARQSYIPNQRQMTGPSQPHWPQEQQPQAPLAPQLQQPALHQEPSQMISPQHSQ